ncbi:hypothetical protein [Geodermatophilus africanus]|uniref:hypothetical protein n=1 Tax=Geodermatophilus africanus TaxID=1137993 RepID=UPI00111501F9|nr:hypothetical protein [Geodermatophilus africanus]
MRRLLGRSQTVAVALMSIHAYSTGLQFHLMARSRPGHPLGPTHVRLAERAGLPVVPSPQFDVTVADGTEAFPLDLSEAFGRLDALRDRTVIIGWRAGGAHDRRDGEYWLTPNPLSGSQSGSPGRTSASAAPRRRSRRGRSVRQLHPP